MIDALVKAGIDGKDIRIITELYWNQKAAIRVDQELSEPAKIMRGVRQGCVLSPYLFNLYTEFIFRNSEDLPGLNINGRNVNNLRYVDDTTLLANTQEDLQRIVNTVKTESEIKGLNMNVDKTKTMVISKSEGQKAKIMVDGKELEQVKSYKYLGQTVTEEAKNDKEISIRIAQAKSTFISMSDVLTSRDMTLALRLKAVRMYIYPIISYGDETWTFYKDTINKIEAFEMWVYRRLACISWKDRVSNADVLERLGVKRELLSTMKINKLTYFGHIIRHESLQKTILTGKVEGGRGRGRPRRQWYDDVKEWTGNKMSVNIRLAEDRVAWRKVARQPRDCAVRTNSQRDDT